MIVNHAGTLKKDFFIAYLSLVMNAKNCTLNQAKETTFERFFKQDKDIYGQETYQQFLLAYRSLRSDS
ncbi:hypothetical protein [Aquibacillus albus]|uniref:Uncharacterized protein n=1 Tax=Aquibacillus albus TaxID=1168171 RepID=A0ABS2N6G5_9BACI|nr:hypothetical protein [Aquibacillus albus]